MAEPWAPELKDVGRRIPTRTRPMDAPGSDEVLYTFDEHTVPKGEDVQPLIEAAVATVLHAVSSVPEALGDLAKDAAAWRTAADVELSWPERDADIREVYDRLNARAALSLQRLIDACEDAGSGTDAGLPVWSMPDPPPWGDTYL